MRILTFSTLYPSAARPTHGIFVETRLRKLVERGISARVVAPCPWFPFKSKRFGEYSVFAHVPREETRHGISIQHPRYPILPKIGMSSAPLALFAALLPLLRRQMREGSDFDLIDAHYFYPDGVAAVMLGHVLGRPVVVTARGSDLNVISTYAIPSRWIRWAAGHAAGLVAVSGGLKRRFTTLGIPSDRVCLLRNGVDLTVFQRRDRDAARRALGFTRPTLLAVGNLVPLKRHIVIIEALARLEGVDLVIVGDGPERQSLQSRARQLGIMEQVRLLGRRPQEDLPKIYSAADLLVHPSLHEGSPNVILESMACGTRALVADFDGVDEIVTAPEAGRVLGQPTSTSLAEAIGELLAELPAPDATRRYAKRFDWQATTEGQIALFRRVCERATQVDAQSGHQTEGGMVQDPTKSSVGRTLG